jgi:hypothetical protein
MDTGAANHLMSVRHTDIAADIAVRNMRDECVSQAVTEGGDVASLTVSTLHLHIHVIQCKYLPFVIHVYCTVHVYCTGELRIELNWVFICNSVLQSTFRVASHGIYLLTLEWSS